MHILVFKEIGTKKKESSHEIFSLMEKRPHITPFVGPEFNHTQKLVMVVMLKLVFRKGLAIAHSQLAAEASADSDYLSFFLFNGRHLSN